MDGSAGPLEAEDFAPHLRAALERALGMRLAADVPTREEREHARELAPRYVDPAFVRRR